MTMTQRYKQSPTAATYSGMITNNIVVTSIVTVWSVKLHLLKSVQKQVEIVYGYYLLSRSHQFYEMADNTVS